MRIQRVLFWVQLFPTLSFWTVSEQNFVFGLKENYLFIFLWFCRSVICDSRHFKQGSNYLSLTILPIRPLGNQVSCCSLVNSSSCTVCKVPVGKLVCRLTESFTYIESNSWQRRQPCFQPAAHKTCRESIVSVTPEFASIILLKTWSRSTFWVKLATDSSGYLNYTKCVFCCVPLLWDFNSRTVDCTSPESAKVQVKF